MGNGKWESGVRERHPADCPGYSTAYGDFSTLTSLCFRTRSSRCTSPFTIPHELMPVTATRRSRLAG